MPQTSGTAGTLHNVVTFVLLVSGAAVEFEAAVVVLDFKGAGVGVGAKIVVLAVVVVLSVDSEVIGC